ncbi:MAG: hypothetical protein R3267_02370 [Paenisporosarcina sp.]|nr:hypothetical protein [Paenisporosarcina sp.]
MVESTMLYRLLPYVTYFVAIIGSVVSGYLVYSGLSSKLERRHLRLRLKDNWQDSKKGFVSQAELSKTEQILREARYPLGLTALRLQLISFGIFALIVFNYGIAAFIVKGDIKVVPILVGIALLFLLNPGIKFTPARFMLVKLIEYRRAKRNAELFSLYDMLVSEIEMMRSTRVNVYSLLRTLLPYFKELNPLLTKMLGEWTSSAIGPYEAVERFSDEVGTNEAKSLATVLRTFDESNRETLLTSLRGMEDMFITSQIENNRRKRKLFIDLIAMPVKAANFLILLNFIIVIIMMVMSIMGASKISI